MNSHPQSNGPAGASHHASPDAQPDLFSFTPAAALTAEEWKRLSTPERFEHFHRHNPAVYGVIVQKAREWRAADNGKLGMSLLFGMVRWVLALQTKGDPYRINDHYVPYYSRLVMWQEPDLADLFDLRSAEEPDAWIAEKRRAA